MVFKIAARDIIRNKKRTAVSVMGIAVSVMLMFSLIQMGDCIIRQFHELAATGMKRDFTVVGLSYEKLKEAEEILIEAGSADNYMISMNVGCWYENDYSATDIIGVEGNLWYFKDTEIMEGHEPASAYEIMIEEGFNRVRKTPYRVGDRLTVLLENDKSEKKESVEFTVAGIIKNISDDGSRIWTDLATADELGQRLGVEDYEENAIAVVAERGEYDVDRDIDLIQILETKLGLPNFYRDHVIMNEEKDHLFYEKESYQDIAGVFRGMAVLIAVCVFVFAFNSFHISSIEKMNWLAAMRCIGISRRQQDRILLWEGVLIGNLGILLGFAGGNMLNYVVAETIMNDMMITVGPVALRQVPLSYLETYVVTMGAILLAVFWILRRMRRLTIVEALRYTEEQKQEFGWTYGLEGGKSLLWQMAKRNLRRNRSKGNTLTLTMTISIVLCLVIFGIFFSLDISLDSENAKARLFQYELYKTDPLNLVITEREKEAVSEIAGTDNVYGQKMIREVEWDEESEEPVLLVYEDTLFELLLKVQSPNEEYRVDQQLAVFYHADKQDDFQESKVFRIKNANGQTSYEIPVAVNTAWDENYAVHSSFGYDRDLLIINEAMAGQLGIPNGGYTALLIRQPILASAFELRECLGGGNAAQIDDLDQNRESGEKQLFAMICLAGYMMLATILLTAIIMSNTIQSNLLARRKEIAIMYAIGLTRKRSICMCCMEHLILLVRAFVCGSLIATYILFYYDAVLDQGIRWNAGLYIGVFVFFGAVVTGISVHTMKQDGKQSTAELLREK